MNNVINDEKQQARWDHHETAMKRVDETKAMPKHEAPGDKLTYPSRQDVHGALSCLLTGGQTLCRRTECHRCRRPKVCYN